MSAIKSNRKKCRSVDTGTGEREGGLVVGQGGGRRSGVTRSIFFIYLFEHNVPPFLETKRAGKINTRLQGHCVPHPSLSSSLDGISFLFFQETGPKSQWTNSFFSPSPSRLKEDAGQGQVKKNISKVAWRCVYRRRPRRPPFRRVLSWGMGVTSSAKEK